MHMPKPSLSANYRKQFDAYNTDQNLVALLSILIVEGRTFLRLARFFGLAMQLFNVTWSKGLHALRRFSTYSTPKTVRAAQIVEYGSVRLNENVPLNEVGPEEVTIRVHAASINPIDTAMIRGYGAGVFDQFRSHPLPWTVGRDCSGVVTRVGSRIWDIKVGDEVIAATYPTRTDTGTWTDYVNVPGFCVARKPKNVPHFQAAAVPYVGLTAHSALFRFGGAKPGNSVLVIGGSGGVGGTAIQLLKNRQCFVVTTCGTHSVDRVKSLGADVVIDYQTEDWEKVVQSHKPADGFDLVLDVASAGRGPPVDHSFALLKRWGSYVTLSGGLVQTASEHSTGRLGGLGGLTYAGLGFARLAAQYALQYQVRYHWGYFFEDASALREISRMIEQGRFVVKAEHTFPLSQVEEAVKYQNEQGGKVVLINDRV